MFSKRLGSFGVVLTLAAVGSGLLLAQSPQAVGTWVGVGVADNPFGNGAPVALTDGRTLIVGGAGPDGAATNVVATFDAATNQFAIAGTLLSARTGHTATLLKDGRVLVTGGTTDSLVSTDIELFDPSTGASTLVAQMAEPRRGHVAALLQNGSVLIAGGYTSGDAVLQSAFVFDPATNSVSPTPSGMNVARASASATSLIDGRVVIIGGTNGTNDLASAEIYDPTLQSFTNVSTQLSVPVRGHSAVLLPHNGSVLVAGGTSNGAAQTGADLFLPAEFPDPFSWGMGQFAPTGAMSAARSSAIAGPTATEGYAVVTGGGSNGVERYRFATIKTDRDDYAPGQTAIITGSGWRANEEVTLRFQEDPAVHDDYVLTVTADGQGNIYHDTWAPEEHDIGVRFYLLATGAESGRRAQWTFTDNVNLNIDNAPDVWHRTGEVPGGFNVAVAGTYTCTTQGSQSCTGVNAINLTVPSVSGGPKAATFASGTWSAILEFRTSPAAGQFAIPADGRYDVRATLDTNLPDEIRDKNNYFGVDNTAPTTTIQCNGATCVTTYTASVQVQLSATDGGGGGLQVSGVDFTAYCIDTTDNCTPGTTYNAAFTVPFNSGVTTYVRYRSTDDAGNVETTKSQAIQFQANTFNVTFNATPIGDVPNATTVLSVTVGANPAVTVTRQDLPRTFTIASGTNVSYSYSSLLAVSATKQYRWLSTAGAGSASGQTTQSGSFSVTQDSLVSATYRAQYLLTLAVNPSVPGASGNISGGTTNTFYDETETLTLQAATPVADGPGAQWRFNNWTGNVASPPNATNPVSVTMSQARSITANYIKQYQLTLAVIASVPGGVTNISGGTNGAFYDDGTGLNLTAAAQVMDGSDTRWQFTNWTGDVVSPPNTNNPVSVTMNQARSITANYVAEYRLRLAITAGVPNGLNNISGGADGAFYASGTPLTLTATAPVADGATKQWRFNNWTGDVDSPPNATNPVSVTMDQPRSITANYMAQYLLALAVNPSVPGGSGNITGGGNGTFYDDGTVLTLTATTPVPDGAGVQWRFDNWTGDVASPPDAANPVSVTMNQARSITANYIKQYQLTLAITAGVPNGLANIAGGTNGTFYDDGTVLNLTADTLVEQGTDTKWRFDNWSGDVVPSPNTDNPVSVTMNQARSITATYIAQYRLTLAITTGVPDGLANVTGGTTDAFYDSGTNLTLNAATPVADGPGKQWRFNNWTGTGLLTANSSNPLLITMDQPRSITANYVAQYLLTLAVNPSVPNGLANIGGGTTNTFYDETTVLNLQAVTPVPDGAGVQWRFNIWSGDIGASPNTSNPISVTMNQARSITANYIKQYQLALAITAGVPNGLAHITGGVNGTFYDDGTILSLGAFTPVPDGTGKRWRFANWTGNVASSPNGANPVSVTMNQPRSITANYVTQYLLTWSQTGLPTTGPISIGTNTVVTISAVPPVGSLGAKTVALLPFSEWFDEGSNVSYAYSAAISTVPVSSIQFELNPATSNLPSTANVQSALSVNGDYSTNTYTIQYLQPLDQSNGTTYHENTGKNGRVIPVKVLIFKNGTAIADTSTVLMKVVGAPCVGGTGDDPINEYADAGASNGNTNLFRWSSPHWIYNLDTRAVGLANNNCYRLDVYLIALSGPTSIRASAATYAIFKPVK